MRVTRRSVEEIAGRQVALAMAQMGLSAEQVAAELGVERGEIEEFCSGKKRISTSQLFALSQLLGKPISFFFLPRADEAVAQKSSKFL